MSYWMMAAMIGVVGVGLMFAALIFRLDDQVEAELSASSDDEPRWTTLV